MLALAIAGCDKPKPGGGQASTDAPASVDNAAAPSAPIVGEGKIDRSHRGAAMLAMPFAAPGGAPATLASFRGKPLLVNFWATWCAPCVRELPTIDALAAGGKVKVVAISEDMGGDAQVGPFWKSHGLKTLTPYTDAKNVMMSALQLNEMPTTILYDAQGKEVWRVTGPMDWSGGEAAKLIGEVQ